MTYDRVPPESLFTTPARGLRVLVVGFTYLVALYQGKLSSLAQAGGIQVGLLAPSTWRFAAWTHAVALRAQDRNIRLFPATVSLFNGRNGAFIYPVATAWSAVRNFRPDIIHVEQEVFSLATFEMAVIARLLGIPLTIFCWENVDHDVCVFRRWTRRFVLRTARLITPGNLESADLLRRWGYTGPMEVMPQLGVDPAVFSPSRRVLNPRPFSIGFIGRLVHEKGIDLIFEAARVLRDRGHAVRVVICGQGPFESDLRERAGALGFSGAEVQWQGERDHAQVASAMAGMDVVVLPSRDLPGRWKEQFGLVLVEAMAMGIPVVGSSCGAIPDVIGRGDLIFNQEDARALASIVERLILDPAWRNEVSQYGRRRVMENYTQELIADRLSRAWSELMSAEGCGNPTEGRLY